MTGQPDVVIGFPPGHFYSPIPDLAEIRDRHHAIFTNPSSCPGIDLRVDAQLSLGTQLAALAADQPFGPEARDGLRYGFENAFFSYGDGLVLHTMLRHLRPRRYVEIGSGWSSALTLDTLDRFLAGVTRCTFIDPYPQTLRELLRSEDLSRDDVELLEMPLYQVDPALFASLQPGDVLFVDSTHVSRVGSDVNQIFFDILPQLPAGVHVHLHDVFWPFEYPPEWVYQGWAWTENYLLRAYMTHNPRVRINWFNAYLGLNHNKTIGELLPLWQRNPGGSIWIETVEG